MAYRRRQGITRASTFKEEIRHDGDDLSSSSFLSSSSSFSGSSTVAAQATKAAATLRDSSRLSVRSDSVPSTADPSKSKGPSRYEYTSMNISNESKGFWGVLARKAKAILEEDDGIQNFETLGRPRTQKLDASKARGSQTSQPYQSSENNRKIENPRLRKGLDAITSSFNHISDTLGNAFEEGRSIVENKTADIIQETRRLQIKRKGNSEESNQASGLQVQWQPPAQLQLQPNQENQIKASRDVAMATAAKAKMLLRELKTVKADLAFAKERCTQLEEENKILRESFNKGDNPADDDLIRLQLETLLAEKARLAHENSMYASENRFLREIVEYHQLTMQDVVSLDEGMDEAAEVSPMSKILSISPPSSTSPPSPIDVNSPLSPAVTNEVLPPCTPSQATATAAESQSSSNSAFPSSASEYSTRQPASA